MSLFSIPPRIYFKYGSSAIALTEIAAMKSVLIISDENIFKTGLINELRKALPKGLRTSIITITADEPSIESVEHIAQNARSFNPDCWIGFGGGSILDKTKLARFCYLSGMSVEELIAVEKLPYLGARVHESTMVLIPTTSGAGAEVSPYLSVVTPEKRHRLYSTHFLPFTTITDAIYTKDLPVSLVKSGGIMALSHAITGHDDLFFNTATAAITLMENLNESCEGILSARISCHHAATQAGIALNTAEPNIIDKLANAIEDDIKIGYSNVVAALLYAYVQKNELTMLLDTLRMDKPTFITKIEAVYDGMGYPRKISEIDPSLHGKVYMGVVADHNLTEEEHEIAVAAM
ncbi:hypothetical protein PCE1_003074 [Barthelona sp. PCE]